jgi:Ca2+-binding RTX toxin-like protein
MSGGDLTEDHRAGRRTGNGARAAAAALAIAVVVGGSAVASGSLLPHAGAGQMAVIRGTPGPDTLHGGARPEVILGKARGDRLFGGGGFDRIRGGRGSDRLVGQGQGALMVGGSGRDQFNMRDGRQIQGAGRDVIRARDGSPDQINCGPGRSDVAYVDRVEDGVYDCERIVTPDGTIESREAR